jgi:hypothetical protein
VVGFLSGVLSLQATHRYYCINYKYYSCCCFGCREKEVFFNVRSCNNLFSFRSLFVHYLQNRKRSFIIIISQTFVEINLIHEELQVFNSIKTHHISSTSTIMKDLYYLFPELFTFETKSNYYDLVFMGRFKKYCPCNLCLIITNSKRELRSLGRPVELFMRNIARSHLESVFFRRFS